MRSNQILLISNQILQLSDIISQRLFNISAEIKPNITAAKQYHISKKYLKRSNQIQHLYTSLKVYLRLSSDHNSSSLSEKQPRRKVFFFSMHAAGRREAHWSILGGIWGIQGILGGSGGLQGGQLYPDGALFAPLEVLYSTKIGSKYHIMVQLAKPHWVRITDPMLDLWDPSKDPPKTTLWANESLSEPQKVSKFHIKGPKCILPVVTIHFEHYLTFGTKSGHFWLSDALRMGQKACFRTICA